MHIKTLTVGPIETNCYVVSNDGRCAIIDPGDEASAILNYLEENHLHCDAVLLTHAHFDHVGAVDIVAGETGATTYMNRQDHEVAIGGRPNEFFVAPTNTRFYEDGDEVEAAGLCFRVLSTPGHTPGSVCLLCEDALFTGDTLFKDSCGRTDFLRSSTEAMFSSLRRLATLPGDYEVYPGHMSATTMERERRYNPYIRMALRNAK